MGEQKGLWIGIVPAGCLPPGIGLYLKTRKPAPPPGPPAPVAAAPALPPAPPPMPLPTLAASDEFLRQHAGELSANKDWAGWLTQSDLIRRAAAAVEIMSNGK